MTVGSELDLSQLLDAAGAPFPGVDLDRTWLLALRCENGIVQPDSGEDCDDGALNGTADHCLAGCVLVHGR